MSIVSEMQFLSKRSQHLFRTKQMPIGRQACDTDEEIANQKTAANWNIESFEFQELLSWLDPDPDAAGWQYELMRQKLITLFTFRGCVFPDELADETINRVTRKLPQIKSCYIGNPVRYFYGVARKVHLEYLRRVPEQIFLPCPSTKEDTEELFQRLDQALSKLEQADRELVLSYYQGEGHNKIEHRKALARQIGLDLNGLRVRIYRIKTQLRHHFKIQK
jgi:DNA-directed RNA polymerase specialized sigma24 family protein